MKKLRIFAVWGALLAVPIWSVEIYNFPDLSQATTSEETGDTNFKAKPKVYNLATNQDFYNLGSPSDLYPNLKDVLLEMRLREYYADQKHAFFDDYFRYDVVKRRILAELNSPPPVGKPKDSEDKTGIGFSLENLETQMRLFGNQSVTLRYGTAFYLSRLDPTSLSQRKYSYQTLFDPKLPKNDPFADSQSISSGFSIDQNLVLSLRGTIGRKIEVEVSHDTRSRRNDYRVEYKGDEGEFVSSVKLGNVDLNVGGKSQFVTSGGSGKQAFGIRMEGKKDNFSVNAILSLTRGVSEHKEFNVGQPITINDINYIPGRFYQLPDSNVQAYELYFSVTGDATNTANFRIDYFDLSSNPGRIYFSKVDKTMYSLNPLSGILDTRGQKPQSQNPYSLLFYSYYSNGVVVPGSASNYNRFMTNMVITTTALNTNEVSSKNFALIDIPNLGIQDLPSSYELRTHYAIDQDIQISTFRVKILNLAGDLVDTREWVGSYEHDFQVFGHAVVNPPDGYFRFVNPRAFAVVSNYYAGLYDSPTVLANQSRLKMEVSFQAPFKNFIDLGRFNIIQNSVVVTRNGRVLSPNDYSVNTFLGRINFSEANPLLIGDKVEVDYEYQPFGSSLQRYLLASRADYVFRGDSYIGSTIALSLGQSSLTAPRLGYESGAQLVMDVDTQLDLFSLFNRKRDNDFSFQIGGEYAFSIFDRNLQGKAVYNDMEGDQSFVAPKSFQNYYFTANPTLDDAEGRRLGKAYFIDFGLYSLSGSRSPVSFTISDESNMMRKTSDDLFNYKQNVNFRPFSLHPGPYQLLGEGHLDRSLFPEQSSLAFDYDFSDLTSTNGYLSFVAPVGYGSSARDFTKFNRLEIIYKLVTAVSNNGTPIITNDMGTIGLSIDVGKLSEDLDRSGVGPKKETVLSDPAGFDFNYTKGSNAVTTHIGAGVKGFNSPGQIDEGNGRIDSADFDNNNQLYPFEEKVTYPGLATLGVNGTNYFLLYHSLHTTFSSQETFEKTNYSVNYSPLSDSTFGNDVVSQEPYVKLTVPLLSAYSSNIMTKVQNIRLNLLQLSNTRPRGRLVIESIAFRGNSWTATRVDGSVVTLANQWSVNTIDTKSDSVYKANQFTRAFRNVYESIHGSLLATEYDRLTESSLELNYNLNGIPNGGASDSVNGRVAWVENIDPSGPKDISYYNQMRFALFVKDRSSDGNEEFVYRFGRDAANYYEVRIPLKNIDRKYSPTQANYWHEYTIHLHARTPEEKKNLDAKRGGNIFALSHRANSTASKNTAVGEEAILLLDGSAYTVTKKGVPTLFDASYTALGVQNTDPSAIRSGSIWVDEMYLNDDQLQFGQSYRMNLAFSKKTPIRINETEVVSEIKASTSFTHDGLNFSSIDKTTGNQSQRESVAFATSFKLLRSLGFSYEGLRDYNVSQYDENLLPKENQVSGETSVDRVSFNLTIPGLIGEWIPNLSHTLSKNHSRSLSFLITNTNVDFDSQNLQAKDLETSIKSYSISENKVFKFGNNFSIGQNYTIGMDITRTISMSTNVQRSAASVFSEDNYLWFPIASLIGQNTTNRSPAFGAFPNANAPVTDKKNWLNLLDYQYRRSQSFSLDFNLFDFRLSVGHSSAETHYLSLSNASDPSLAKIAQTFEPETTYTSWYEFYWPELRSIFQDSFLPGKSVWTGKERRYNLSLDYGKPLVIFQIPILSRIGITASYNYTEGDFRDGVKSFPVNDFLKNHYAKLSPSSQTLLSNYATGIGNFYSNSQSYRDLANSFNLSLSLPIGFGDKFPITSLPFSFARVVAYNEDNAPDFNGSDQDLWKNIARDFPSFYSNGDFGTGDRQLFSIGKAGSLLAGAPPYFDAWFLNEIGFWMRQLFNPGNAEKNRIDAYHSARADRARLLDQTVNYLSRPTTFGGSYFPDKFISHGEYGANATLNDSFDLKIYLKRYSFLDIFMPSVLNYSGALVTAKNGALISQTSRKSFSVAKDFDRLTRVINDTLLKPGDGFSRNVSLDGDYAYEESIDYNAKLVKNTHTIGLRSNLKFFRDLTMSVGWNLSAEVNRQVYRYTYADKDGKTITEPYLGIGDPVTIASVNSILGLKETLNIGTNENFAALQSVSDLGAESMDYVKYTQGLSFTFRWNEPKPVVLKIFGLTLPLPPNSSQSIGLNFNFYDYAIPGIDNAVFTNGLFTPDEQKNAVSRKNLLNFASPYGNREFPIWSAKTSYNSTLNFSQNFSLTYSLSLAAISQLQARSYVAYLKVPYLSSYASKWQDGYMRDAEYIQMGFDVALTGAIRF